MQPQPQNCNNGSSPLSPDDHMQQDQHHHHPNQKSAIATTLAASAVSTASSASPMFPTSLHHHFHQMHPEGGFDHHAPPPHDDFLEQMLSSLNSASAWDLKAGGENDSASPEEESENGVSGGGFQFDESSTKLRAQQMLPMPFGGMEDVVHHRGSLLEGSSFDSFHPGVENQMAGLFDGNFVGSLLGSGQQMNHLPEHLQGSQGGPGFDQVPVAMNNNQAPLNGAAGAAAAQPKQRVRARRGQATDPHSIAERLRRERIAERMKGLQELVPNANKTDKASMLDEIIEYVKFLQLQVKVLSMSRLGGAGAVAPLVGDNMSSEGVGDSLRARAKAMMRRGVSNGELTATSTEEATPNSNGNNTEAATAVSENKVAKLMEEDMGSAMQYLQSKGLCLMPISLAAAISTAKNPLSSSSSTKRAETNSSLLPTSKGNGPVSPKC